MILPLLLTIVSLACSAVLIAGNCIKREREQIKRRKRIEMRGFWHKGTSYGGTFRNHIPRNPFGGRINIRELTGTGALRRML